MGFLDKIFGRPKPDPQPAQAPKAGEADTADWESGMTVPQELAASEALELHNSNDPPLFLDVREPHELEADGMIPGSIHMPTGEVAARMGELDPNKPVVVYCASGMRSMDIGALLLENGFRDVSNLNGGLMMWQGPVTHPDKC